VSTIGVQLPGREDRWAEAMPSTVDEAVGAVAAELAELVPVSQSVVVFGQSFGGLLGYELTRRLGESHGRWPSALVVLACRPPHLWVGAGRGLVEDEAELRRLLDLRGLRDDELDDDSRELMLDVLRCDAQLSLGYTDPCGARLECPLYAWGGSADQLVAPHHLDGWAAYAAASFVRWQLPGGHHLPDDAAAMVIAGLRSLLAPDGQLQPSPLAGG
jgi:surfactin synthase thioesterase subunit